MARGQEQDLVSGHQAHLRFGIPALVLGNLCLACGSLFVRMADTGPISAAFWRIALATPFLFLIARAMNDPARRLGRQTFVMFALSGLCFAIDLAAWHLGISKTKLANANLLGNSTSFLLPLYAFAVARRWPSGMQAIALTLAAIGAVLLVGRSFELSPRNFAGDLLCLLAGVFYTAYLVLMGRMRSGMGPWPVLAWSTMMSTLPLLFMALAAGERLVPQNWAPIVALALLSQIVGQGLMIYVVGRISPVLFGLTFLVQPMVSAFIGWYAYDERFGLADWVGMFLIGLSLILVSQPDRKTA